MKLDPVYVTCPVCKRPVDRHKPSCVYFEPYHDPDRQPAYPFTRFEPEPQTNDRIARRMYIESMYAMQMHIWCTRRREHQAAAEWKTMFLGYLELCSSYEKSDGREPHTEKWVAQRCSTPDCRGLFWTTNIAKWRAARAGRPQPSGCCNACRAKP
jgi:hypothetical protein